MTAVVLRADARRLPLPDASVDLIVTSPPYFGLRSYTDTRDCPKCRDLIADGRDPRQAWPDYQAHWDRDHKPLPYAGQIGSEGTPAEWVAALVECTREWVRVLKPSGSIFVNLGDKFAGSGGDGNSGLLAPKFKGNTDAAPPSRGKRWGYQPKSLLGLPWRYALACTDELGLILRRDIVWAKPNGLPESVTDRCRSSHERRKPAGFVAWQCLEDRGRPHLGHPLAAPPSARAPGH
jgi:DNA modification methylase